VLPIEKAPAGAARKLPRAFARYYSMNAWAPKSKSGNFRDGTNFFSPWFSERLFALKNQYHFRICSFAAGLFCAGQLLILISADSRHSSFVCGM
jgi:hypothetical protein